MRLAFGRVPLWISSLMVHTSQFLQSNPCIVPHIGSFSLPPRFLSHSCGFIWNNKHDLLHITYYSLLLRFPWVVLFWHVYVLPPGYFVWPCSPHIHRTEFVTSHNEQKTKVIKCGALQVWPISTLMPLESKIRQNTINNTDWNVSCYCNSKLPKTYTWSGTFILKDGRYM
jgi:hypothetical protein